MMVKVVKAAQAGFGGLVVFVALFGDERGVAVGRARAHAEVVAGTVL
jgi:hypothetical protein